MTRRKRLSLLAAVVIALAFSALPAQGDSWDFSQGRWVDLTHSFDESTLYWPTADGFSKETVFEGQSPAGFYYSAYNICTAEHGGTHLDAPVHFSEGRQAADEVPLERLIGPAVVIDIAGPSSTNADYQLKAEDLQAWESTHGQIPDNSIVLIRTDFSKRWPNAVHYMGTDQRGAEAVAKLHFPGIHPDAAEFLANVRTIAAVGIDTPSLDFGQSRDFMAHRILMAKNIPGFENLANLSELPLTGALVIALPMKIAGGSGGPLRIVSFVPNQEHD